MSNYKFEWNSPANTVQVAGTFSNWNLIPLKQSGNYFSVEIPITNGIHEFKFIVDGEWSHDENVRNWDDGYGGKNNVIIVGIENEPTKQSTNSSQPKQPKQPKAPKQPTIKVDILKKQPPSYWDDRIKIWDRIKQKHQAEGGPSIPNKGQPLKVTLPDGNTKDGIIGVTTPMDIAKSISSGLAQNILAAKVDDKMWDVDRPLEKDCKVVFHKFDTPEGKKVFWHSSAHIMGQALEKLFSCDLCIGPPLENGGFYYDMALPGLVGSFEQEHAELVRKEVEKIIKEKQSFERLVLTKEEALEMFGNNKYKRELISEKVADGETTSAYRCGPLIDLCKGPHLPHTGKIKAFDVWKNASAYWKGNAENDNLQRVYGMTFPDNKQFNEWKKELEMAKERDHRLQGTKQELYFFHQWAPGCPFFLPRGAKLYNKLMDFIKVQYRKRGFTEVITPNMFNSELWKTSGHWQHYKDDMFVLSVEEQDFALKPMNCPGHCLMFKSKGKRPYKELPLRFADFGVLHRNELSGALTGLTRVRRFCQDDAHIFCREDQIASEIQGCFEFLKYVYNDTFGWYFTLELSTRPEKKYIGDIEVWDRAEAQLAKCLDSFVGEGKWKLNPGDGAFYGPKIDIHVFDALKREHQCATIQLDFNLPKNFDLSYINDEGQEVRPVMIHRAVLGSIERFMAILVENTAGKWPFWLSPRPAIITSIHAEQLAYAQKVCDQLQALGFDVEIDVTDHTVQKKVAVAQSSHYNYILVVGPQEEKNGTVNIRQNNEQRESTIEALIQEWQDLINNHK